MKGLDVVGMSCQLVSNGGSPTREDRLAMTAAGEFLPCDCLVVFERNAWL